MSVIKTEVGVDVYEVRSKIEKAMEDTRGMSYNKSNSNNVWQWDNKHLYPDYDNISTRQRVYEHLKNAKSNGTLDRIQEYETPLAVGVKATNSKLGRHNRWFKRYAFDLTRIQLLSKNGRVEAIQNYHEYEFWNWCCHEKHVSSYQDSSWDKIKDKLEK
jgi:hypothetical protein